ncbi:MAG: multicopper oxidase family protein [Thermoanaerobaculia bacterium]
MLRRLVPIVLSFVVVLPVAAQSTQSLLLRKPFQVIGQQAVIPNCPGSGEELKPPTTVTADGNHVLSTTFKVTSQTMQVPVYVQSGGVWTCSMKTFDLRLYTDPESGQPKYPGPTLLVRRQTDTYTPGDQIKVLLQNDLASSNEECVWAQGNCDCTQATKPQCCKDTTPPNGMNCFHGDNTTNLHFHGTHVSPQSPQDYVLLQLTPAGTPAGSVMHGKEYEVSGQFQYAVNPLPANQSEGTHWYHPHKHGSTAEQVGNGMAGAVIIKGPFDDWLQSQYGNKLREKLLVVQQVHDLNFNTLTGRFTPLPLINGQLVPQITMYKGEIQRWRIVNANIDAAAQFVIDFDGVVDNAVEAKQIAMDGVQFSPKNYQCQPMLDATPCDGQNTDLSFQFSPGNRADFLVKAPGSVGEFFVPYEVFGNVEEQGTRPTNETREARAIPTVQRALTRQTLDAVAPGASQPALLSINVVDCPRGMNCEMQFPATLPDLPPFLRPITPKGDPQKLQFQVVDTAGKPKANPAPAGIFGIWVQGQNNNKLQQFREDCAAFTEVLDPDGGEEWHISQNLTSTNPFHVFHIHTNPFQVLSTFDTSGTQITYPEPIWQDSVTLPSNQNPGDPFNPKGEVVIRQRFEDYTGMYVLHCHFLGHEDRGMMLSVQTVCPNQTDSWSATSTTQKECTFGRFIKAKPPCASVTEATHAH